MIELTPFSGGRFSLLLPGFRFISFDFGARRFSEIRFDPIFSDVVEYSEVIAPACHKSGKWKACPKPAGFISEHVARDQSCGSSEEMLEVLLIPAASNSMDVVPHVLFSVDFNAESLGLCRYDPIDRESVTGRAEIEMAFRHFGFEYNVNRSVALERPRDFTFANAAFVAMGNPSGRKLSIRSK